MQTIELTIRGMDCAECARHVEGRLAQIDGVDSVQVLLTAEKGIISYDASRVAPPALVAAIGELGYPAAADEAVSNAQPTSAAPARARGQAAAFADVVRLAFVGAVALLVLAELLLERLGVLEAFAHALPAPLVLLAVLAGGFPIFKSAFLGLRARQINADLLMTVAIVGASAMGEFTSAALIVFFMSISHWLEGFTASRSRAALRELIDLAPKTARAIRDGREVQIAVNELHPGDRILVRPGERLSADGRVTDGATTVDQSPITGESLPINKRTGDDVFAGSVNLRGAITVQVTQAGRDSTLGKIIRLVEQAEAAKAPVQKFADRYSAIYLPVVLGVSALTFLVTRNPTHAMAVLVVACPCAIALATPLAVVAGVGRAARQGILIKGGLYLEQLASVDVVVMDKTGTLTLGRPLVTDVLPGSGVSAEDVLRLAAAAERYSEHPLASAILAEAHARGIGADTPALFQAVVGRGVVSQLEQRVIVLGNRRLMEERGVAVDEEMAQAADEMERRGKTVLYLSDDHAVQGIIAVADMVRDRVPRALDEMRSLGIRQLVLLTGDNERVASALAEQLGVQFRAGMLPQDKMEFVLDLQREGKKVAMIGDGINDAPALAQADVGIAMGAAGTDAAIEAAQVALMRDDWDQVPAAVRLARRTFRTIQQNIAFGLLFNLAGLSLAAVGILTPVMAAAAQSLPDVVVFLNSSRLLRHPGRGN